MTWAGVRLTRSGRGFIIRVVFIRPLWELFHSHGGFCF